MLVLVRLVPPTVLLIILWLTVMDLPPAHDRRAAQPTLTLTPSSLTRTRTRTLMIGIPLMIGPIPYNPYP